MLQQSAKMNFSLGSPCKAFAICVMFIHFRLPPVMSLPSSWPYALVVTILAWATVSVITAHPQACPQSTSP